MSASKIHLFASQYLGCNIIKKKISVVTFLRFYILSLWGLTQSTGGDRLELSHASPIENISHVVALRDVGLSIREELNRSDWFLGSLRSSVPKK